MSDGTSQTTLVGAHSEDWESGPWPSKTNRADADIEANGASNTDREKSYNEIAKAFVEDARNGLEGRIFRALSVSGDASLRREAVRERRGEAGSYRAKTVAGVIQAFITWFLAQDDLVLRFPEFDMDAPCSYDKDAALSRYGDLCDLERGALEACRRNGDSLYTGLLGITASHLNANGQYRCPADHWREMRESWNGPVRRELQRVFDQLGAARYDSDDPPDRWWEYVRIAEPHGSGYAHHHIAVVTNFEIVQETFEPVIARHVETIPSSNWSAHDMSASNPEERCVSVNEIDPEAIDEQDVVGNLASYLSGYLSEFDENGEWVEMLEKSPAEVMFAATAWATGSRRIDFSNGAHDIKRLGNELRPVQYNSRDSDGESPGPVSVRNTRTGEEYEIIEPTGVEMVIIDDRSELDPEKVFVGGLLEAPQ